MAISRRRSRQQRDPDKDAKALLGEHLCAARVGAEFTSQPQLAKALECDTSVVGKVETGERVPHPDMLTAWLDLCRVTGRYRQLLEGLAAVARAKDDGPVKIWISGYLEAEARAHTIRIWQPLIIHGLFQTESYTSALFLAAGADEAQTREQVGLRAERQAILTREQPPSIIALIDESVLYRPIGPAEVMHGQLTRLLELSRAIVIQVIRTGANAGLGGAITLAAGPGSPEVLAAESLVEDQVTTDAKLVLKASTTFDHVRADALNRTDSRALLQEALKTWNNR